MGNILEVEHLIKNYGNQKAVDDLSFVVESGSIFAFLGENGAGKSTTISCLTTLLKPTSGEIRIDGLQVGEDDAIIRNRIGVVFQESILDWLLSPREILEVRGTMYNLSKKDLKQRIEELVAQLDMGDFVNQHYRTLSGGQRRRVDIARALIHRPSILFLDEPTTGLDPLSRTQVWDAIKQLRETQNLTVFLTTHYMDEVENAEKVLILDHGKIKAQGSPVELKRQYAKDILTIYDENGLSQNHELASSAEALKFLTSHEVVDFEFRHGTMDDVFLAVTGKGGEHA
jgi:multidrug/hemolysin transport system ATP-binding protein